MLNLRWFCYGVKIVGGNCSALRRRSFSSFSSLLWNGKSTQFKLRFMQIKFYCNHNAARETAKFNEKQMTSFHLWNMVSYVAGTAILVFGLSYAAVPLYRMFCQATGFGGTVRGRHSIDKDKIDTMSVVADKLIKIRFEADTGSAMAWNFKPLQREILVRPGETALAFYSAKNPSNIPVVGISTYNVIPYDAGMYFSKIQCFCFEEQMLNPGEELEMPVFFYIDPDIVKDPKMQFVDLITLGYTFFQSDDSTRKALHALQVTLELDANEARAKT